MVMSMRDLSHQATVADSPARLRSLVDRTSDVLLLLDAEGSIVYANRRLTSHYGHDNDRVAGSPLTAILHPDDAETAETWLRDLVASGGRATSRVRLRVTEPNGASHDVEWQGTNQFDDPLIDGVIATGRDVTELVAMEAQVREQHRQLLYSASHDALTGLLNRPAFLEAFAARLAARRDEGDAGDVVVLFCDLDRFKAVNDTYGHQIGDQVLVEVAARFLDVVGPADLLARYGGDEFTILLSDSAGPAVVTGLVGRLKAALTAPIMCGRVAASVGVTVGVCRSGVVDANIDAMLRDADHAMYEGKASRR
jgi:diguanylate cyclase (GGDEF)-like protein/PAS domain S-box-containing protein